MKILIVDDEVIIRALLLDVLRNDGHDADAASSGHDALKLMKKKAFDVVFSDVHMPAMNGYELLTAINAHHPGTSVVMMDSYPEELSERCLREGAIHCVHKPFDITELRGVIQRAAQEKRTGHGS
jgi:CheY-like chemotaxis protein